MDVNMVCTDWKNNIISTPAYMQGDASPHEVFDGIQSLLYKVSSVVKQREAAVNREEEEAR